jgi:hypothetical protein
MRCFFIVWFNAMASVENLVRIGGEAQVSKRKCPKCKGFKYRRTREGWYRKCECQGKKRRGR